MVYAKQVDLNNGGPLYVRTFIIFYIFNKIGRFNWFYHCSVAVHLWYTYTLPGAGEVSKTFYDDPRDWIIYDWFHLITRATHCFGSTSSLGNRTFRAWRTTTRTHINRTWIAWIGLWRARVTRRAPGRRRISKESTSSLITTTTKTTTLTIIIIIIIIH